MIEFSHQVARMNCTGVEVVGAFIYCYDSNEKNQCFKKLNSIFNRVFPQFEENDSDEEE